MDKEDVGCVCVCVCVMEYPTAVRKKEILLFVIWIALERIMLSEVSQTDKGKYHMISFACGI